MSGNKQLLWVIIIVVLIVVGLLFYSYSDKSYFGGMDDDEDDELYKLEPAGVDGHIHMANLNSSGDGLSSMSKSHQHEIENYEDVGVKEGDSIPPHKHSLTKYIVDTASKE